MVNVSFLKQQVIAGVVLIVIGLFISVYLSWRVETKWKSCTETTPGTVTSFTRTSDNDGGYDYNVTVSFEINGSPCTHSFTTRTSVEMNEAVTVYYDPNDINKRYVKSLQSSPFEFRLSGVFFAAVGVYVVIRNVIKIKKLSA